MGKKLTLLEIERSIIKKYRKQLYSPMIKAIKDYEMISPDDKIAVCISGGKDSLLLAKALELLQRYSNIPFSLEFICIDPGFNPENKKLLIDTCKYLNINLQILETDIFAVANKLNADNPCYMCAKRRRGALYTFAQQLGCNKIALGHHFDDIIETTMLNILYAGNYGTMLPKLPADNFKNMELIRPLTYVRESDIIKYTNYIGIEVMNCGCAVASKLKDSKRQRVKELLASLRKEDPLIDKSIFASGKNVNLDTVQEFKYQQKRYNMIKIKEQNEKK